MLARLFLLQILALFEFPNCLFFFVCVFFRAATFRPKFIHFIRGVNFKIHIK